MCVIISFRTLQLIFFLRRLCGKKISLPTIIIKHTTIIIKVRRKVNRIDYYIIFFGHEWIVVSLLQMSGENERLQPAGFFWLFFSVLGAIVFMIIDGGLMAVNHGSWSVSKKKKIIQKARHTGYMHLTYNEMGGEDH